MRTVVRDPQSFGEIVILQSEVRICEDWQPLLVQISPLQTFRVYVGGLQVAAGEWDATEKRVIFWQGDHMPSQVRAFAAGMVREECLVEYAPDGPTRSEEFQASLAWHEGHPSR